HPQLADGKFTPRQAEADNRSWLSKETLGLIDGSAPLPPGQTRADQDMKKQCEGAKDAIPRELRPVNQGELDERVEKGAEA
ncbi:outer membrane protein assembly factor BamD, partial [Pseudomonas syringae pv. tagetis]